MRTMKEMPYVIGIKAKLYLSAKGKRIVSLNDGAYRYVYNHLVSTGNEIYELRKSARCSPWAASRMEYLLSVSRTSRDVKNSAPFLYGKDIDSSVIDNAMKNYRMAWKRKNHCLSKSISDAGWHSFLTVLSQKAAMYGRTFMTVDPRNTTQTCSACGHVLKGDEKLTLSDREWTCPRCGTHHSRDANAAVNILKRYMDTRQKEQQ